MTKFLVRKMSSTRFWLSGKYVESLSAPTNNSTRWLKPFVLGRAVAGRWSTASALHSPGLEPQRPTTRTHVCLQYQ